MRNVEFPRCSWPEGALFHIADTVIQMDAYRPMNITEKVKAMLEEYPLKKTDVPDFVMPEFKGSCSLKKQWKMIGLKPG